VSARARAAAARAKTLAERLVLSGLPAAPKAKVPARLLYPRTGLPRTNVQATCRPKGTRAFVCLVRTRDAKPNEGLVVGCRLRSNGTARLSWYSYRRG
jgi:hypothetical protein